MLRLISLLFILFCFLLQVRAQLSPAFYNVPLPGTGAAYCMMKDAEGLLWIGSGDGLFCYDGYRCYPQKSYQPFTPYGIQAMTIVNGIIYLGCDNGFFAYDIRNNRYESLIPNLKEVNAMLLYGNIIYIGCKQGLWQWNISTKSGKQIAKGLRSVYAIVEYGENLLIGAIDGLFLEKTGRYSRGDTPIT